MEKMAVFAPIPNASAMIAVNVNAGARKNIRKDCLRSWMRDSMLAYRSEGNEILTYDAQGSQKVHEILLWKGFIRGLTTPPLAILHSSPDEGRRSHTRNSFSAVIACGVRFGY